MRSLEICRRFRHVEVEHCFACGASSDEKVLNGLRVNGEEAIFMCTTCLRGWLKKIEGDEILEILEELLSGVSVGGSPTVQ